MAKPRRKETLPAVLEQDPNAIAHSFHASAAELQKKYDELRAEKPGPIKAAMALELGQDAKRYLEEVDASEVNIQRRRLWESHRSWNKVYKVARSPGELSLKYSLDVRAEWEIERRRLRDEEQRKRELQANLDAAQQRAAEVEHLRAIGKEDEACAKEAAPIVPITVSVDPDLGKPAGEIMVEVWQPKRDENGNFVFRLEVDDDEMAYRRWITENVAMWHLMDYEYGKTKRMLTDNRGMVQPPGLEIEHNFEPRTRREDDDF